MILLAGIAIASGVFVFSGFSAAGQNSAAAPPPQWTQEAGSGIFVPACSSSSASATCSGGAPQVTLSWSPLDHLVYTVDVYQICAWSDITISGGPSWSTQPCTGTVTWGGAANNTTYTYTIQNWTTTCLQQWPQGGSEFYSCGGGTPHIGNDVMLGPPSTGSFTTPNCAPPTADIKANGSDGPISIWWNTASTISWSSSNASSCSVSPPGWGGTSGSQSTGNLTSSQTYTLSCSGPGGSVSDSVTVNVGSPPTADIKANGSNGPISIEYGTSATISWTSSNVSSCSVSPPGWTGTSGSQSTGSLTSSQTYSLSCSAPGGSASDSVAVNISGSALSASCSVAPTSAIVGGTVTWTASPSGGTGSYTYSWSGTDGLSGTTQSVQKSYSSPGNKSGSVTVTSGSQTIGPLSCSNSVQVSPQTLSVTLGANPSSGTAPLNGVDLTATVSGTAQGAINYTFYCDRSDSGTNVTSGWAAKYDNTQENPKTAVDACNYSSGGTYTAKVIVERGSAPAAEARQSVTVSAPALADLVVINPTHAPANPTPGQDMTFAATFRNDGTVSASAFIAGLRIDGGEAIAKSGLGLAPNGTQTRTRTWTDDWTATAGTHSYQICADDTVPATYTPPGAIAESNENNNCSAPRTFTVSAPAPQCSDLGDNDGDGSIDFGPDPGCSSPSDDDERNACTDGIDNDGDGKVDFDSTNWPGPGPWPGKDPGCSSPQDNSEANPPTFCEVNPDDPNATCP